MLMKLIPFLPRSFHLLHSRQPCFDPSLCFDSASSWVFQVPLESVKLELMPFRVEADGPANVSQFFLPEPTETVRSCLSPKPPSSNHPDIVFTSARDMGMCARVNFCVPTSTSPRRGRIGCSVSQTKFCRSLIELLTHPILSNAVSSLGHAVGTRFCFWQRSLIHIFV